FVADRYFHSAMDCVEASITGRNALARPGCVQLLKKAISWAPANPVYHYELAKQYERMMHEAAVADGTWEQSGGRTRFVQGARSKQFETMALSEYGLAIERNPAANYFHLDLARLIAAKLYVEDPPLDELVDFSEEASKHPLSAAHAFRRFSTAVEMAPNRSFNRRAFAEWLVSHILYIRKRADDPERYERESQALFTEALVQYRRAVSLAPHLLHSSLNVLSSLTTDFDTLQEIVPENASGMRTLLLFLHGKAGWEANFEKFLARMDRTRKKFDQEPGDPDAIYAYYDALASVYEKDTRTGSAIGTLQAYLALDPENAAVHGRVAALARKVNDPSACTHYRRALESEPDNRSWLRGYIAVLPSCSETDEVESKLQELLSRYPAESALYEALGTICLDRKDFARAESAYRKIVTDTADNARGYFLLGNLYNTKGEREQALENFKKAALLNRGYRNHFNRMLSFNLLLAEYFKSTRDYKKLKSLLPLSPSNLQALILFLYRNNAWLSNRSAFFADLETTTQRFLKAKSDSSNAARLRPWLSAYYTAAADIYLHENKKARALELFDELITIDPENAPGHMRYAELKNEEGDFETAEAHYQKAIEMAPKDTAYRQAYARALAKAGKLDMAETVALSAIADNPKDPELHETLGDIYVQAGKFDRAADELSTALTLSKGAERYRKKLAKILAKRI
ncbi:MAG: tetratricopeptide repeat protein, partial [Syntrophales bacterium]|nr:tetratricopeptide repeat protein [Syntrophales bacterium]